MSNITTFTLTPDAWLYQADCRDVLRALPENSIDSVCCDPPYHLTSVVKRFGGANAAPAKHGTDGLYARQSAGFLGKVWDGGDIAFDPETWVLVLRVLKPGGHCVAFGAPRGYHRMACAIEDAGFEIRDSLMWVFGSGMPKSHSVSLAIDKAAGVEREVIETIPDRWAGKGNVYNRNGRDVVNGSANIDGVVDISVPATPEAIEWEGWGTSLKPSFEPIVLARKPLEKGLTIAANVLKWRTGAINIDACRVPGESSPSISRRETAVRTGNAPGRPGEYSHTIKDRRSPEAYMREKPGEMLGRWPGNLAHDGGQEVVGMFPYSKDGVAGKRNGQNGEVLKSGFGAYDTQWGGYGGEGSAARFFYSPKTSKADRQGTIHPTTKPTALMQWLSRLVTPSGGVVLDPFAGSGSTGVACLRERFKVILCEREVEYIEMIHKRFAVEQQKASAA